MSGRRHGWRRRGSKTTREDNDRGSSYIPPEVSGVEPASSPAFVMSAPSPPKHNITSGISTLFRRKSDRLDHHHHDGSTTLEGADSGVSSVISQDTSTPSTAGSSIPQRLFYSETNDSDDSYESKISQARSQTMDDDDDEEASVYGEPKTIVRYRGFSTSLSSLFLDEALVCASMGCFGLALSNRTEYLLTVRNDKRGQSKRRKTGNPSKIMGYGLVFTLLLIATTFIIWGFGNGNDKVEEGYDYDDLVGDDYNYNNGDDDGWNNNNNNGDDDGWNNNNNNGDDDGWNNNGDDDANNNNNNGDDGWNNGDDGWNNGDDGWNNGDDANNNNNGDDAVNNRRMTSTTHSHSMDGVFKLRDYHEHVWEPIFDFCNEEWNREEDETDFRVLEDYGGGDEQEQSQFRGRNLGADIRFGLLIAFLIFLGLFGRKRRMRTRYALVRARAQDDHLYYASASQVSLKNTREDQFDGACSHTLCGCYPVDPPMPVPEDEEEEEEDEDGVATAKKKRRHQDCVSRGFSCFLGCCCGFLCKCWFQCLSVCALAQEAREMRLLLPPRFQRIDYITHQPFIEYQKDVNDLRRGWMGKTRRKAGLMPHIYALSRLSRYILFGFTGTVLIICLTLLFNPRAAFSYADAIVLLATFVQSFIVLYVVHWIFHKSDLSLDAVIKFFAAGFLIAVPSAFFFEGLLVNSILIVSYTVYALLDWLGGDAFVTWVFNNWKFLWILGELINAYLVAAVTEELCKYYTFRTVEHPDLIFLTGLDRESNDGNAVDGGHIKYSYGSHQVSQLNRANSFGSVSSHRSTSSRRSAIAAAITRTTTEEEFYEDDNDARTYRQKAAAVTTGMISVAVGLACAENFLYVFVLGGAQDSDDDGRTGRVMEEWIVLLFRSIFPIHALAAAMQSINMIRKFVECTDDNNHRIGVGRIILPAVILHGTFDAILLSINVFVESAWDKYLEENDGNVGDGTPYNPVVVNLVAWASIIFIMLVGILWYYRENRNQRLRLILLEERDKARDEAETHPYTNPTASSAEASEVELV